MENNLQTEIVASTSRPRPFLRLAGFSLGIVLFGVVLVAAAAFTAKPSAPPEAKRKAVVVELFTSEGCSSCPPADALLSRLRQQGQQNGVEIIPLGFHVDYWNYLGWQDRFSSQSYSKRQEHYARTFAINGPYTPQMVVDGLQQFVGSDASRAREAMSEGASQVQKADVQLALASPDKLMVHVSGEAAGDVVLAITEDNLVSQVRSGENSGHELRHMAVVRDFRTLGKLAGGGFDAEVPLALARDWKTKDVHFVVFVQEASGKVEGAASLPAVR